MYLDNYKHFLQQFTKNIIQKFHLYEKVIFGQIDI